jgi:menaquinone-dependent protoporphyrinogen IX oxidase
MKSILLIYKSKTGFTRKYATWISDSIDCKVITLEEINKVNIDDYDIIIYGAGIKAGLIRNLKDFKKFVLNNNNKKIIIFATGGAPDDEKITNKIKDNNFSKEELADIEFFYFQSGLNYEKMELSGKLMMNIYKWILKIKHNKSDMENGTSSSLSASYDASNKNNIKELIDYLKSIKY